MYVYVLTVFSLFQKRRFALEKQQQFYNAEPPPPSLWSLDKYISPFLEKVFNTPLNYGDGKIELRPEALDFEGP